MDALLRFFSSTRGHRAVAARVRAHGVGAAVDWDRSRVFFELMG